MRGDSSYKPGTISGILFQFTPLREGRPVTTDLPLGADNIFQFTPLREGRQLVDMEKIMAGNLFQFTPLREGRLKR